MVRLFIVFSYLVKCHSYYINHVLHVDGATSQGQPLIEGGVCCTEAPSMRLLFSIV